MVGIQTPIESHFLQFSENLVRIHIAIFQKSLFESTGSGYTSPDIPQMNHEKFSLAVLVVDLIQNDGGSTRFCPRPTAIEIAAVAAGIGIDHPVESEATESCIWKRCV